MREKIWDRLGRNPDVVKCCREAVKARYPNPRAQDARVRIPQVVVRRPRESFGPPAVAALASAGRGAGDVRVRLYLWLFLLASDQPQGCKRKGKDWARLLNLLGKDEWDDERAHRRTVKRVKNALNGIEKLGHIANLKQFAVTLLDPRNGKPYRTESDDELKRRLEERRKKTDSWGDRAVWRSKDYWEKEPLDLPVSWWFNGLVSALRGAELACLLMLWDETHGSEERIRIPRITFTQYGLRKGLRQRGLEGLEILGLLTSHNTGISGRAVKYEYEVNWKAVSEDRDLRAPDRTS